MSLNGTINTSPARSAIEVLIVRLGGGDDQLTVTGTPTPLDGDGIRPVFGPITLLHGGGNTLTDGIRGADSIEISGAAPGSTLVVYGDTTPDGGWYAGAAPLDLGPRPFGGQFLVSGSIPFEQFGDDVIDAGAVQAALGVLPVRFIAYGGAGEDLIVGSQDADWLAGGSADDVIAGNSGDNVVLGDNGLDVAVLSKIITVVSGDPLPPVIPLVLPPTVDPLLSGSDLLTGGDGNDLVVGDQALPGPTGWTSVEPANGAADVIDGGAGNDSLLGGNGADVIDGGSGNDVIIGDNGTIGPQLIGSLFPLIGGDDTITAATATTSCSAAPAPHHHHRRRERPRLRRPRLRHRADRADPAAGRLVTVTLFTWRSIDTGIDDGGAADVIDTGAGDDIVIGGQGGDRITAGDR